MSRKRIPAKDLTELKSGESLRVKVAYADAGYPDNHFGPVYRPDARMWLHKDLAAVVQDVAKDLHQNQGWLLLCLDGLRTVEAQVQMGEYVRANKERLEEVCRKSGVTIDSLISSPGVGAHPRGLAIDVQPLDAKTGAPIDMGTSFDDFTLQSSRTAPASAFGKKGESILRNRAILNAAFEKAATTHHFPLEGVPTEWWDFRSTPEHYNQFEALREADLPPGMRMTEQSQMRRSGTVPENTATRKQIEVAS